MTYTGPDRRKSTRKETSLEVDFSLFIKDEATKKYSNDFEYSLDHTSTANMGGGGLCIKTQARITTGTKVLILIELPNSEDLAVAVTSAIWSKQIDTDNLFQTGLAFSLVKPTDKDRINSFLK